MADTEEPQFNSLAERIAALSKQKSFNTVGTAADGPRKRAPPPPPPGRPARTQTAPVVPTNASKQEQGRPGPPPLPSRTASFQPSPALPPRRTSTQSVNTLGTRRNSASSEASMRSSVSSLSTTKTISSTTSYGSNGSTQRKLPPVCDLASLPPLPPTRRELEAKAKEAEAQEAAARETATREAARQVRVVQKIEPAAPARPNLPPRLPSGPAKSQTTTATETVARTQPAIISLKGKKPLGLSMQPTEYGVGPRIPVRPKVDDAPPPVPVSSRPSTAQIQAISIRPAPRPPAQLGCLICRDWSGPDNVAAQFPRESLPRNDPVGYLARGLCDPFPSYTDKARAIFTWFHHNISYDTVSFFNNDIKGQTPEQTIFSGRAVCQGYADTYAGIAIRAGLECVVVSGHGKGFGHNALKKGERPPPPKPSGHAWNAVRIDGGEWKLLDACWGAGHICTAANLYKKEFHPNEFTSPNDALGRKHFPSDTRYQFRDDGRVISWEEYYIGTSTGECVEVYGSAHPEGILEDSIQPKERQIPVYSGEVVRFQFSKLCEHWTSEKNGLGKAPLLLLHIQGVDGRKTDMVPIETDGYWHWLDVNARDLGAPGQSVYIAQLSSFDGKDGQALRAVTAKEFCSQYGRVGMAFSYLAKWDLV
ncbi:Kyphoscoliosis peptidase-like protein [Cladobotryum mycophilum]|uniref:Kyphoscoliosis peptidase-like protein n=1 Tax=Cladobotryum mycophilum TaxID=491253 RepID=A0ABR0T2Z2_9HYPO